MINELQSIDKEKLDKGKKTHAHAFPIYFPCDGEIEYNLLVDKIRDVMEIEVSFVEGEGL